MQAAERMVDRSGHAGEPTARRYRTMAERELHHLAVLSCLDADQRAQFRHEVGQLAAQLRTGWVSNEGPGVVVDVSIPDGPTPFVVARDEVPLAYDEPHGGSLGWFG